MLPESLDISANVGFWKLRFPLSAREGRFLLEMERTFGWVDADSARELSDVTSFGNVTAFFIFPLSFQLYGIPTDTICLFLALCSV